MSELREWDTSAANNNSAPPDGFPENMNYSAVNNAAREVMAVLARFERDTRGALTAGGTANAITVTPTGSYAAYFDGMQIGFTAANTNTGAVTLNVGSVGAVALTDQAGNAMQGGEIVAGAIYQAVHDGTAFRLRATATPSELALGGTSVVDLSNAETVLVIGPGTSQHLEMDGDELQSKSDATTAAAIAINRLGGNVNIGPQSGTGVVSLFHSGDLVLTTESVGVGVRHPSADNQTQLLLENQSDGSGRAFIGYATSDTLTIRNQVHAGTVVISGENTAGTVVSLWAADPDGGATTYHLGEDVLTTRTGGVQVRGDASNANPIVEFVSAGGTRQSFIVSNAGGTMQIKHENHGENILITGEDTGGTSRNILVGDPDGGTSLYHIGVEVFSTRTDGVEVDGDGSNIVCALDDGGVQYAVLMHDIGSALYLRSNEHGVPVRIQGEDAGGTAQDILGGDPDGATTLYFGGTATLSTASNGVVIDAANATVTVRDGGSQTGILQKNDTTAELFLRNQEHSGHVLLQGEDSGGSVVALVEGDPDGSATLYFAGTARLQTDTDGITVSGDDLRLSNSGAGATRIKAFNSEGGFILLADGDTMQIRQSDASGADEDTWIAFANNGAVTLYNDNTAEFATQDSNASGNTSGAQVKDHGQTLRDVGFNVSPLTNVTAAYTLQDTTVGGVIRISSGTGDIDITTATTDLAPDGSMWTIVNESGSNNTIDANTGITLTWQDGAGGQTGGRTRADGGVATVYKRTDTQYLIWGNGLS